MKNRIKDKTPKKVHPPFYKDKEFWQVMGVLGGLILIVYLLMSTIDYYDDNNGEIFCQDKGFEKAAGINGNSRTIHPNYDCEDCGQYDFVKCYTYHLVDHDIEEEYKVYAIKEIKQYSRNHVESFWSIWD